MTEQASEEAKAANAAFARNDTDAPVETPVDNGQESDTEPETFPRSYVEELRREAADNRVKAKDYDALAGRLFLAEVRATGRLADPTDMPYDPDLLGDETKLAKAIDDLLARKPHLALRVPTGNVGQGVTGTTPQRFSLGQMLRSRA